MVKLVRNKYLITLLLFGSYLLFFADVDLFTLYARHQKINTLKQEISVIEDDTRSMQEQADAMDHLESLERVAREEHLFKKPEEEIFVLYRQ